MKRLLVPVLDFVLRAARRLRFFPFSLVFLAVGAALRRIELRRGRSVHLRLDLDGPSSEGVAGARAAVAALAGGPCDLLLRQGPEVEVSALFSVALANPAVRSVGFYWDGDALADDLPLWGATHAVPEATAPLSRLQPYTGALREGELLLLRLAAGRPACVLDDPDLSLPEALALAAETPDMVYIDLRGRVDLAPGRRPGNLVPLGHAGLGLHQALALVAAADIYVGSDPVLAAVARRCTTLAGLRAEAAAGIADGERM